MEMNDIKIHDVNFFNKLIINLFFKCKNKLKISQLKLFPSLLEAESLRFWDALCLVKFSLCF